MDVTQCYRVLASMHKALGSIPITAFKEKLKEGKQEGRRRKEERKDTVTQTHTGWGRWREVERT